MILSPNCKWFRQIIPLGIRHTFSLGTNDIPHLQASRFTHTLGAPDPIRQVAPQLFTRAVEVALGISFNTQSQAPDIPDISSRPEKVEYTWSLNSTAPDIPSPSLCASTQELSESLNAQTQASDIPGFSIRDALAKYSASLQSQAKAPDIPSRSLRASKHELSVSLNAQTQAPDDPCPLHPHGAPSEFVLTSSVFKTGVAKVLH